MDKQQDTSQIDLKSLFETSKLFNSTYELPFITQHILRTVMGKFLIAKGFMFIKKGDELVLISSRGSFPENFSIINNESQLSEFASFNKLSVYPLKSNQNIIGYLGIGFPLSGKELSEFEVHFLESLLEFASGAIENSIRFKELNDSKVFLAKKVQELRTLYEISNELNGLTDSSKVFNLYVFTVMGQGHFNGITIYQQLENGDLVSQFQKGASSAKKVIADLNVKDFQPIVINAQDELYDRIFEKKGKEPIFVLPIKSNLKGLVVLKQSPLTQSFEASDHDFYLSLTHLLDISLSTIEYFKESLLKQQLEGEIKVASEIQNALLPSKFPKMFDLDCFGANIPSKTVGGDYFDISKISETKLMIAIADVTGKGIPASLLMANLQSMIKVLIPLNLDLSKMTSMINQVIYENTAPDKFITFFWGILDFETNILTFVNAGHNPPYLVKNGELIELNDGGLILGVLPSIMPYETGKVEFSRNDRLFIYTDGVTEAMNESNEEFGDDSLKELLVTWKSETSKEWIEKVFVDLKLFTGTAPQSDDITMIALKW